ncbi:hypothetical protein KIN20_030894, partial [Parelaphostrongylus tenuis]
HYRPKLPGRRKFYLWVLCARLYWKEELAASERGGEERGKGGKRAPGTGPTLWAACRAVIFGCVVIVIGLAMTVLGYFDKHFSERVEVVDGSMIVYHDRVIRYQLKSMQYLGPILMGIGAFILIIACVVTLESRDKHAQLITEESSKKKRLISIEDHEGLAPYRDSLDEESDRSFNIENKAVVDKRSISTWVEVHRPRCSDTTPTLSAHTMAPLAEIDSLDLHSCSSQIFTDRDERQIRENSNGQEI